MHSIAWDATCGVSLVPSGDRVNGDSGKTRTTCQHHLSHDHNAPIRYFIIHRAKCFRSTKFLYGRSSFQKLACFCLEVVVVGSTLSTASDALDNTGISSIIIANVSKSGCSRKLPVLATGSYPT
jgi:hypothetical protein